MAAAVPGVEGTDHADPLGIGRPHREARARQAIHGRGVCAQLEVDAMVVALAEQVQVVVRELRREVVRVVTQLLLAARILDEQPVRLHRPPVPDDSFEQAVGMYALERPGRSGPLVLPEDRHLVGARLEHPNDALRRSALPRQLVVAEHRARLPVPGLQQRLDLAGRQRATATRAWTRCLALRHAQMTGRRPQIRSAYSRMLRSLENRPIETELMAARRLHSSGSRNSWSTRAWADS